MLLLCSRCATYRHRHPTVFLWSVPTPGYTHISHTSGPAQSIFMLSWHNARVFRVRFCRELCSFGLGKVETEYKIRMDLHIHIRYLGVYNLHDCVLSLPPLLVFQFVCCLPPVHQPSRLVRPRCLLDAREWFPSHTLLDPTHIPTPCACYTGNEHHTCLRVGDPRQSWIPSTPRECARLHCGCNQELVTTLSKDIHNLLDMFRNNIYATTSFTSPFRETTPKQKYYAC
jgi:hypothetical protein